MNNIIISGRLVADPVIRSTSSGTKVANIRVAVDRNITRDSDGSKADFFDVVAWNKSATFVENYFFKGKPILIQGRLQSRTWESNGAKHYTVEIVADRIEFCGGDKKQQAEVPPMPDLPDEYSQAELVDLGGADGDLPF